ncbi:aminopeptidase-like protein [Cucurbitaria berberidis CBS 394.84]|uniref:Aminopeptidase n=1 Tax=Cucurbitaria berberidis CBS 394.84 TaxID=1168544 RepID=A0A9P4GFI2_9PLEO|nr:aminopeptidase-like protein [Cucurbitaria berberidis CBS 394.84]KAF1844531.1 aminopeptidase-like protein [Cucurbitaria berberidis CBS 394.84]
MASDRDILPAWVKPAHYTVSLHDLEFGGSFGYQGTVTINTNINKDGGFSDLVLNAHQLKIHAAELKTGDKTRSTKDISYDEKRQRVTLDFGEKIEYSGEATLEVKFEGTINNIMAGFYRSKYTPKGEVPASVAKDDEFHYMFSTQFESCDARRAFPCFDEPNLKATFDVEIEVPKDQIALSNMPEKEIKPSKRDGFHTVVFERTPVMSTYLLAWAIGDFEYVEAFTERKYNGKNIPVRVYTTRGLKEQGRFALDNCHKIVDYFSEVFQIDYPLPKVDLLAVHEFSHGAMENWGLITYRTTAVLFDPATSADSYRNRVAYVVAHELAHQWFGNLVTMDWWSELWLNEGFATWVGWFAIDHLYPDWNVWGQFVTDSVQQAFALDALRTSHPIEVPVYDGLEVDQIFDHISYLKGSSVIRMLSAHLGEKVFLQGVADYLKAHQYSNATTNDLWSALSKASGQDVNSFMDFWVRKIGFPVVTVSEEPGQIGLRQQRFLLAGDVKSEEDQTTWWIPLGLHTGDSASASSLHKTTALTQKEDTIRGVNEGFYQLNKNLTGFYRTNYPPDRLKKLGEARDQLSVQDKIGLIGDAYANAVAGYGTTSGLLALVERFEDESDYLVWSQILTNIGNVRSVFSGSEDISEALRKYHLKLVTPAVEKVGWDFREGEGFLLGQLRASLILSAALVGHKATVDESLRRFDAYISGEDKNAIHPSLRRAIFATAIKQRGDSAFKAIKNEYLSTTSIDGKEICLQSLGRVQTPELAQEVMSFIFSDKVAMQDKHSGTIALANNSKVRPEVWKFVRDNWDSKINPTLSGNLVVLERFLRFGLNKFADEKVADEIAAFFKDKDTRGYDKGLEVIDDTIRSYAGYKKRDEKVVREWLGANGYLA